MKYVVIVCDGLSDRAITELNNKTPLSAAKTPVLDKLAGKCETGIAKTTDTVNQPDSLKTNMYILGYDPLKFYSGRPALSAISSGIRFTKEDTVLSCSYVELSDEEDFAKKHICSVSAELSEEEKYEISGLLKEKLGNDIFTFASDKNGNPYIIWKKGEPSPGVFFSPEPIVGEETGTHFPKSDYVIPLSGIMEKSYEILSQASINKKRREKGRPEINAVWIEDYGTKPEIESFSKKYGITGAVITDDRTIAGFAKTAGMHSFQIDSSDNFSSVPEFAFKELKSGTQLVYIHTVKAAKAALEGNFREKVKTVEDIDKQIIEPLHQFLKDSGEEFRIMIISSFACSCDIGCPTAEPVPYMIYDSRDKESASSVFDEIKAFESGKYISYGSDILQHFIDNENNLCS